MFQPENPQPNLPIKPYPVRKYHYSHNLCHGLLHNAVYCAVRTHDLSLAQLSQTKSRSWRFCSTACPFEAELIVTSQHRLFNCQCRFLSLHINSQKFEQFLNLNLFFLIVRLLLCSVDELSYNNYVSCFNLYYI